MSRTNTLFIILLMSGLLGCVSSSTTKSDMDKINFMLGEWQYENDGSLFIEKWELNETSTMVGIGMMITNTDTIVTEKLAILYKGNDLYFVADVPENKMKVSFKMVKLIPNNVLFKNENHDFPKTINYIYNESGYLYAKAEGKINEERVKREYFFKKKK